LRVIFLSFLDTDGGDESECADRFDDSEGDGVSDGVGGVDRLLCFFFVLGGGEE
jgi:hypothetical protein